MAEYIEREALKAELEKISPVEFGGCLDWEMHKGAQEALRFVGYAVDEAPAADVAPVVQGRWIRTYEDCDLCHECSLCGKPALLDGNEKEVLSPWCPRCGAEMDGDKP